MRPLLLCLAALVACVEEEPIDTGPELPCAVSGAKTLEFQQYDGWGSMPDGCGIEYGTPPQGGAPYSPFRLRIRNLEGARDGVVVTTTATDRDDGTLLGTGTYNMWPTCANVGENTDWFVTSEVHMRFYGFELSDLTGREVDLVIAAETLDGEVVSTGIWGALVEN